MSYINSTLFFEPTTTTTKTGVKKLYFKARSKSGGAKAELFPINLDKLSLREERAFYRYCKKIGFSCSVHIKRNSNRSKYSLRNGRSKK